MASKKVIFVIVEGVSDQTALAVLMSGLLRAEDVRIEFVGGDITTRGGVTPENIADRLAKFVKERSKPYFLTPKDFCEIVHIVDTDGAYIADERVIQRDVGHLKYYDDRIEARCPKDVIRRNAQKRANINRMLQIETLLGAPYSVYFFSCNLDHVIHNNANLADKQKDKLAARFANRYMGRLEDFLAFLHGPDVASADPYDASWRQVRHGLASLSRLTNLGVYFSPGAKSIPREFV